MSLRLPPTDLPTDPLTDPLTDPGADPLVTVAGGSNRLYTLEADLLVLARTVPTVLLPEAA
jgi:hypothetical protein